ncbi:MAG: 50S ribosomal protein L9 [Planctomycetota bacterium]
MKLLLLKEVEGLGGPGDLVNVALGYARNFLLPRNLASEPTPQALRRVDAERRRGAREAERLKKEGEDIARSLENCSVNIPARAGEGGHLFGSVGADEIAQALREKNIAVDARQVALERPLKELGVYSVTIRLDAEHAAEVSVWVVDSSAPAAT